MAKKPEIWLTRLFPIIANCMIIEICIEYWFKIDFLSRYLYVFLGYSFYYILHLYFLSKKQRFCLWHRILLTNMCFTLSLEFLDAVGVKIPDMIFYFSVSTALAFILIITYYFIDKNERGNRRK